jgi:hypothetical protein
MHVWFLWENQKENDHWADICRWEDINKMDFSVIVIRWGLWSGLIWPRI